MSLKDSAKEVLDLIERGTYEANGKQVSIASEIDHAISQSRLYLPDEVAELRRVQHGRIQNSSIQHSAVQNNSVQKSGDAPIISVVSGTTQQVAQELANEGPLALLNFASARNVGGGFLNGAKAQEEDLCRCSALYATLTKHTTYYEENRRQSSLLYTDHLIFSPAVPFFKTRGTGNLLSEPFLSSVITAPAPNTRPYLDQSGDPKQLVECFERRWRNVLAVAIDNGISTILLGAWGCGAFGGDPSVSSQTAWNAIKDLGSAFKKIVFAIPDRGKQSKHNLDVFKDTLLPKNES